MGPIESGLEVGIKPKLDASDLETAKRRLALFDDVFILEDFHSRDRLNGVSK